jgi:hypothetical protein
MKLLRAKTRQCFFSLNIVSCRPPIKYQERIDMERELEELDGSFIIFPE